MFNLQFAFARARALAENFQNQRGAIHDFAAENLFQIARLRGRKFVVKDDGVHAIRLAIIGEFLRLARPDVSRRDRHSHFLNAFADDFCASGFGKFLQFVERFAHVSSGAGLEFDADEKDADGARVLSLVDERFQIVVAQKLTEFPSGESAECAAADAAAFGRK